MILLLNTNGMLNVSFPLLFSWMNQKCSQMSASLSLTRTRMGLRATKICPNTRSQTLGQCLTIDAQGVWCTTEGRIKLTSWCDTYLRLCLSVCMTSTATSVPLILGWLRRTWSCTSAVLSNLFMMTTLVWMVRKSHLTGTEMRHWFVQWRHFICAVVYFEICRWSSC